MQSALILIFRNNENDIKPKQLGSILKNNPNYMFCLIDNKSSDNSLTQLKELKLIHPNNVRIVEIKKKFNIEAAARAGYRYLNSLQNWRNIGYANFQQLFYKGYKLSDLLTLMESYSKSQTSGKMVDVKKKITQSTLNDLISLKATNAEQPNAKEVIDDKENSEQTTSTKILLGKAKLPRGT